MEWINIVLSGLGSIASILGVILTIKKKEKTKYIVLYAIIFVLTTLTSILSYEYLESTNKKLAIQTRKDNLKIEANKLLIKSPAYISYFEPGENEGMIYGLLILLESNKDIFPETYESYKMTVIERIGKADSVDIYKKREIMEEAGKSAFQFLKSLSN